MRGTLVFSAKSIKLTASFFYHTLYETPSYDIFLSGLYGTLFPDTIEASFAICTLFQDLAYIVIYLYSPASSVRTAIILQIVYVSVAMVCYVIIEIRQWKVPKRNVQVSVLINIIRFRPTQDTLNQN